MCAMHVLRCAPPREGWFPACFEAGPSADFAILPPRHRCSALGKYSPEGAATCTDCPAGQYSPSEGLADQQEGANGIRCLLCPLGSIALKQGTETMPTSATIGADDYRNRKTLSTGATTCEAW